MSLKNYKSPEYLFKEDELFVKTPKGESKQKLLEFMLANQQISVDEEIPVNMDVIRYVLLNFTNFIDEANTYTDEELSEVLDDGIPQLNRMTDSIIDLLNNCKEEILRESSRIVIGITDFLNAISYAKDEDKMWDKMVKVMKKNKINITKSELMLYKDNPVGLTSLISAK